MIYIFVYNLKTTSPILETLIFLEATLLASNKGCSNSIPGKQPLKTTPIL